MAYLASGLKLFTGRLMVDVVNAANEWITAQQQQSDYFYIEQFEHSHAGRKGTTSVHQLTLLWRDDTAMYAVRDQLPVAVEESSNTK